MNTVDFILKKEGQSSSSDINRRDIFELPKFRKVSVLSDIYRVDDRAIDRLPSPSSNNTQWLYALLAPLLHRVTGYAPEVVIDYPYPDPLSRISFYRRAGREFSTAGWASLYEQIDDTSLTADIAARFIDSLVVSYELPPYLEKIFSSACIPYIDFSMHPVRFLPDYMLGVRSNVRELATRIFETQVPHELIGTFARISAARTANVYRSPEPIPGSCIFFGQVAVDASLIANGQIANSSDVDEALLELSSTYPRIYYRPHPHCENPEQLKKELSKLREVRWVEWNTYDAIALARVSAVASMSSSVLIEAEYFNTPVRRMLNKPIHTSGPGDSQQTTYDKRLYCAAPPAIILQEYWNYIFGGNGEPELHLPAPTTNALRFVVNMKWGR